MEKIKQALNCNQENINFLRKYAVDNIDNMKGQLVTITLGNQTYEFPILKALLNMELVNMFQTFGIHSNLYMYMYSGDGSGKSTNNYINNIITYMRSIGCKMRIIEKVCVEIVSIMSNVASYLDNYINIDISLFDILDLIRRNKRAAHILLEDKHINKDMSPTEIDVKKKQLTQELFDIFKQEKIEPYDSFLASGSGMRIAQFSDSMVFVGSNPQGEKIVPFLFEESWYRGVNTIEGWYVKNVSARVAKILEKVKIDKTGTALKSAMNFMRNLYVSSSDDDCGSVHTQKFHVTNRDQLDRVMGMYYYNGEKGTREERLKRVTKMDNFLIGKTIHVKTPAFCNTINGKICKKCMGIDVRDDIDIGLAIAHDLFGQAGQDHLSAKHNNISNPKKMIPKEFEDLLKISIQNKVIFLKDIRSVLITFPDERYETLYSSEIEVETKYDNKIHTIKLSDRDEFYINKKYVSKNNIVQDITKICCENKNIPKAIMFEELTRIFLSADKEKKEISILDIIEDVTTSVDKYSRHNHLAQIGILLHRFLRDKHNPYKRPDFSEDTIEVTFAKFSTMVNYLPVNETIPQGKRDGLPKLLGSPKTYNGGRIEDHSADIMFIKRNKDAYRRD